MQRQPLNQKIIHLVFKIAQSRAEYWVSHRSINIKHHGLNEISQKPTKTLQIRTKSSKASATNGGTGIESMRPKLPEYERIASQPRRMILLRIDFKPGEPDFPPVHAGKLLSLHLPLIYDNLQQPVHLLNKCPAIEIAG